MERYQKMVAILRKVKDYGSLEAGFVGIIQGTLEWAEEHGESDTFIAEEVRAAFRAYKEVIGEK